VPSDLQQGHGAVAVLHTGGGDHDVEEHPSRIDKDMACAPLDRFVRINAAAPLFRWSSRMDYR
jgi:hypothetical protein